MTNLLSDDVAVVTGGASDGRAICQVFVEHGADVVVADIRKTPREGGHPTHEFIEAEYGQRAAFVE